MPIRPAALLKRSLIFVHRWLGVALSIVFLLWFVSGIVMMYWSFPGVSAADRLEHAPAIQRSEVRVTAQQAFGALGIDRPSVQVRLTTFDGRPVYRFSDAGGDRAPAGQGRRGGNAELGAVYADDGTAVGDVNAAMVDRAAAAWSGRPASDAIKTRVEEVDQWTVGGAGRGQRPLYKYSWPDGQEAYVGGATATVVQYTTRWSRFWAYMGAIPHWLYFTPLRKHGPEWFSVVVWSSLAGTIAALLGVIVAVWMYSPRQRYRHAGVPTSIPYRGWKRWHTITGLVFGTMTATWAFSGLLSMGPFPVVDRLTDLTVRAEAPSSAGSRPDFAPALKDGTLPLAAYEETPPAAAIARANGFEVKEIEYASYRHQPVYILTSGRQETRIVPVGGEAAASFDAGDLMARLRELGRNQVAELRLIRDYDAYYLDRRREQPLPVIYARLNDAVSTRYYIDPRTATIVHRYSDRGWVNRWLYHGLHSLDFPWLYKYRPLWDVVVVTLMLGGTAVCVTSLMLAWRVLARKLSLVWTRLRPPDEDLALTTERR